MAEHPSPSSDMPLARSVFNKITETVDNFKLHSLPLLSLYEQWKSIQSSFAMAEASMKSRAKKLEMDERRVESMLSEISVREESVKECLDAIEAKNKEIEERSVEVGIRAKEYDERFKILEFNEKVVNDDLDVKEKRIRELGEALEVKKAGLSEELRVFEARKRGIEEGYRCLEAKEKGMVKEIEVFESKKKKMMEEFRDLEEREGRLEVRCRGLEAREKEIEKRTRVEDLRTEEMNELEQVLEMRAKEIIEERRVLEERRKAVDGTSQRLDERSKEVELREKELVELQRKLELKKKDIDKGFETCCEELRLKKDELVESHTALGLKESEIVEKCKELELKQERLNEQLKALKVKEKEITCRLKAVELKGKETMNDKRVILVNENVDFIKTVEPNTMDFSDDNTDHRQLSVAVKEKQVRVGDLKSVLIKKCTNLFKQADVLKQQYAERKLAEDGCSVPGVKEVISENPQAENLAVAGVVASRLSAEIQLVFRNDDARATASYLTDHAKMVSMWQKNILDLREEITGLLECLIAERKHLQAAMCTCVFEMKDVYPPEVLLNTHLEHVRGRAEEIVKKASGKAQDDAANMELSALRNVLRCISDFKLELICPPAPHELRITQLEQEMEVRAKPTKFLLKKKNNCDMGTKLEASGSTTQTKTSPTPNLSAAISDSHPERKRKASSSSAVKQKKHHRCHL